MNFGLILKQLRTEKGLTQNELAKILDVSKSNISKYEAGSVEPNISILMRISEYFEKSVDYLLGKSDASTVHSAEHKKKDNYFFFFFNEENPLRNVFSKRIRTSISDIGLTEEEFKNGISFGRERANSFLDGSGEPTADDLIELSQFLDTSIDYLLGQIPRIGSIEKKLLNAFISLDTDNQDIIMGKIKELLKEQRHESVAADPSPLKKTGTDNPKK